MPPATSDSSGRQGAAPRDHAQLSEVELSFQSSLDPYSHTKLFLTFGEEEIGVEEAYIYYTGLPGRLRVDAGKFRQAIGDLNRWHAHALPESEYPLVYRRFLGDEGLAGVGISLYTALPVTVFGGTHEAWFQATSAESEPLYANSRQPTFLGRLQNFWQLNRSTYIQLGATATGGNASSEDLKSRLMGADLRFTWRPPASGTRQDVTVRAEGYRLRTTQGGDPDHPARRVRRCPSQGGPPLGARRPLRQQRGARRGSGCRVGDRPDPQLVAERIRAIAPRGVPTPHRARRPQPDRAAGGLGHGPPQT